MGLRKQTIFYFILVGILLFIFPSLVSAQLLNQLDLLSENSLWDKIDDEIDNTFDKVHEKFDNTKEKIVNTGWSKILTHEDFPSYQIKLKEPNLCDPTVKKYSGYLDTSDDKHFFFWFFESRNDPSKDPVVLWLNGGPGCSSLTGLYFELGPCSVDKEGSESVPNPHSWNSNASVIFLDQPINVGYSYGDGVSNTLAAASDVYAFLQIFFKEFPKFSYLDFHIAGESYAGHYIPAIASEVNNHNKGTSSWILATKPKNLLQINLASILIGNGLVDPLVQYKYYPDMACNSSYEPVLDQSTCDQMRDAYPTCAKLIENCYSSPNVFTCVPASVYCNNRILSPYVRSGQNTYDVRKKCEGDNLCYPSLKYIEKYLNLEEVKSELGVNPDIKFKTCNMQINFKFQMSGDWMRPFHLMIPPLLSDKIRVLIYAGDADFICNWFGNDAWVKELSWSGKEGYNSAKVKNWYTKGDEPEHAGEIRTFQELTFAKIYEAGHMVPYDQPHCSLDLFNRWLLKEL